MRRALAAALVLGAAAGHAAPASARPIEAPARLMVTAREFSLELSRPVIRRGAAIVQLVNLGEDGHDLRLVRRGGRVASRPHGTAETRPGAVSNWRGRLSAGRYVLFCSLPGHERRGMRAVLRVR